MIDLSMLQDFIIESGEDLEELETNLLQLEAEPHNREVLNNIFRAVHTLKGSSEYLGMPKIAEISHSLENLLELLRQGRRQVDRSLIDTLIAARDRIVILIADLQNEQVERSEIADIMERIKHATHEAGMGQSDQATMREADETDTASSSHQEPEQNNLAVIPDLKDEGIESYEEEADEELFDIFLQQLKENLAAIVSCIRKLPHSEDKAALMERCLDSITGLKSSANYMGYENLVSFYATWRSQIQALQAEFNAGKDYSTSFMDTYIDRLLERFPQINRCDIESSADAVKPVRAGQESASLDDRSLMIQVESIMDELMHDGDDQAVEGHERNSSNSESSGLHSTHTALSESSNITSEPENELEYGINRINRSQDIALSLTDLDQSADNHALFEKLGDAFDAVMMQPQAIQSEFSLTEIENNLFSQKSTVSNDQKIGVLTPKSQSSKRSSDPGPSPETDDVPDLDKSQIAAAGNALTLDGVGQNGFDGKISSAEGETVVSGIDQSIESREEALKDKAPTSQDQNAGRFEVSSEKVVKQSLRVDAKKIDALINQVGELVVSRAWFSQLFHEMKSLQHHLKETVKLDQKDMKLVRNLTFRLSEATVALGRVANDLQEGVMKVRMLPIAQLFGRYPRLVRELVKDTAKQVHLELRGEDTELDKMIIEELSDPLIHIIRNAVDHGMETVQERKKHGKSETGTLRLEAYHESNHVVIEVTDDGKGIDTDRIKSAVIAKGLLAKEEVERMSQKELMGLIMKPGLSTATRVTHTSGRGVGMDVVKRNIENLNGTIEIDSTPGMGTRFRIKIPLTLAIIPALMVRVGGDLFTVPLATVVETLRVYDDECSTIEGVEVIHLRDNTLPLVRLSEVFHVTPDSRSNGRSFVVVVNTGMKQVGLVVDALIGQEEVVIKPLEDYLQENSGFSGATILGDGRISLILDIYELVNLSVEKQAKKRDAQSKFLKDKAIPMQNNIVGYHMPAE